LGLFCPNGTTGDGGAGAGDCFDWDHGQNKYLYGMFGTYTAASEVGIEDLTIEFPNHTWQDNPGGYYNNSGYNGIALRFCENCWVKNVTIKNADNGIFLTSSNNVTLDGMHFQVPTGGNHFFVAVTSRSNNILVTNFRAAGKSGGLTNNWGSEGTVFSNGWGDNLWLEGDHSCGITDSPCVKNVMFSNISGNVTRTPSIDRNGNKVPAIYWNVGKVDRCPLDAYTAQH
jgi:parallel beta-helix repeat protein